MMKISIVVTTRNRFEKLMRCIDSIKKSNLETIDWELLVVDDCSEDKTSNLKVADFGVRNAEIIHCQNQAMMVKARNIGARKSQGDYVLFIDDDNEVDKDMIRELIKFADNNNQCGVVGPAMYYLDSKKKYLNYQKINFFTSKTTSFLNDKLGVGFQSDGMPNCFLVKREVFEKCGYFNEQLIQTLTEPDFAFQARRFGYDCIGINEAKTFHDISAGERFQPEDLGGDYIQKAYCLMRNRSYIIGRYGKFYHKIVYFIFFSWLWPLLYSVTVFRYGRFDLVKLYWLGWKDGMIYLTIGKLKNYF